ncbi:MAG: insulinase family protein [Candidatus Thioglobus sp.]|nr:insulinase family protein [Candidatus Thioglobus sp.]
MAQALIFVIFTTFSTFSIAEIEDFGVTKSTLENGLKIIVKVDNRAPVFISQLWYKVGSSDEHSGLTGISHMLEHMMFKGSSKYPAGEFSKIIAKNGGTDNAFTSRDYSAYYQKMHKSKLALSLELEADRMQNLVLQKTEFEKERKVVIEERRLRIEDNPNAKVYEHLQLISFAQNSGYYAPIIGFQNDIGGVFLQIPLLEHTLIIRVASEMPALLSQLQPHRL